MAYALYTDKMLQNQVISYIVNHSAYFTPLSVEDVFGDNAGRTKFSKAQYRAAEGTIIKVKQLIIDEHKKLFPKYWERCRTVGQDEEALRILKQEGKESWEQFFAMVKGMAN